MEGFDVQRFIEEVRIRPVLWDRNPEECVDREQIKQAWYEIVLIFSGSDVTPAEQHGLHMLFSKKWRTLRGSYSRELNRQRRIKLGQDPGPRKNEYVHFQQLRFLEKVIAPKVARPSDTEESIELKQEYLDDEINIEDSNDDNYSNDPLEGTSMLYPEVKKPRYEPDQATVEEDKMFLLSMLSSLQRVPLDRKMKVKIKLMTALDEATRDLE